MSKKLNIEQLINSKLGEAELVPSAESWSKIRRKYRRAEFLRFNPDKLNIFYVAGLFVAGVTLTIALLTSTEESIADSQISQEPEAEKSISNKQPLEKVYTKRDPSPESLEKNRNVEKGENITNSNGEEENDTQELKEITSQNQEIDNQESGTRNQEPKKEAYQSLIAYFTTSVQSGCVPLEVEISNQSQNAESYIWSFGEGTNLKSQSLKTHSHTYSEPGTYTITLTVSDSKGLSSTHHQTIEVHPRPTADFDIMEINGDGSIFEMLNYSTNASSYIWQLTNPEPGTRNRELGSDFQPTLDLAEFDQENENFKLSLIATNDFRCSDTLHRVLPRANSQKPAALRFPNAFAPIPTGSTGGYYNPNEINNTIFYPRFNEEPAEYKLLIYNRTGEVIFESTDIYIGWDGYRLQERSATGVYIWRANGKWVNGEPFEYSGDVTLIWKK